MLEFGNLLAPKKTTRPKKLLYDELVVVSSFITFLFLKIEENVWRLSWTTYISKAWIASANNNSTDFISSVLRSERNIFKIII